MDQLRFKPRKRKERHKLSAQEMKALEALEDKDDAKSQIDDAN